MSSKTNICDPCNFCCPPTKEYSCAVYVADTNSIKEYAEVSVIDSNNRLDPKSPFVSKTSFAIADFYPSQGMVFDRQCNLYIGVGSTADTPGQVVMFPNRRCRDKHTSSSSSSQTIPLKSNSSVREVEVDDCGNLYIADNGGGVVYKVGCGGQTIIGSGPGSPLFNTGSPWGLAFDNKNELLYVSNGLTEIKSIDEDGNPSSNPADNLDVTSTMPNALLTSLAINSKNQLFVADQYSNNIYRVVRNRDIFAPPTVYLDLYASLPNSETPLYIDFDIFDNLFVSSVSGKLYKLNIKTHVLDITNSLTNITGVATKKGPLSKNYDCDCDSNSSDSDE